MNREFWKYYTKSSMSKFSSEVLAQSTLEYANSFEKLTEVENGPEFDYSDWYFKDKANFRALGGRNQNISIFSFVELEWV